MSAHYLPGVRASLPAFHVISSAMGLAVVYSCVSHA